MFFVVVTFLDEGVVGDLVGPFQSGEEAMNWADARSLEMVAERPEWTRESSDDIIMVSNPDESLEEAEGVYYQVLQSTTPIFAVEVMGEGQPGEIE